jgi:tRNA(fMet)-specific endonuclease VapC
MNLTYLLDTNIWSLWSKGKEPVGNHVEAHADEGIAISVVTACEAFYGWGSAIRKRPRSQLVKIYHAMMREIEFMRDATVLPFTIKSMAIYESLQDKYRITDKADLRIAAIAIEHDITLVTQNTRDFEGIKELTMVDWTK